MVTHMVAHRHGRRLIAAYVLHDVEPLTGAPIGGEGRGGRGDVSPGGRLAAAGARRGALQRLAHAAAVFGAARPVPSPADRCLAG